LLRRVGYIRPEDDCRRRVGCIRLGLAVCCLDLADEGCGLAKAQAKKSKKSTLAPEPHLPKVPVLQALPPIPMERMARMLAPLEEPGLKPEPLDELVAQERLRQPDSKKPALPIADDGHSTPRVPMAPRVWMLEPF
jgi:hypothetical protein